MSTTGGYHERRLNLPIRKIGRFSNTLKKQEMKNKILFIASLLFGLMMINAGLNKFLNYMPMPDHLPEKMVKAMRAFVEIGWLMPLIGVAEIAGGLFIIL